MKPRFRSITTLIGRLCQLCRLARHVSLLLTLLIASPLSAQSPLHIVTDTWPPYVTDDSERPGIDVEITQAVLERLGVKHRVEIVPWKRALGMLERGEADALLATGYNASRESYMLFPSEAVSYSETTLFCASCDVETDLSSESFKGKTIALNRGYSYAGTLDEDQGISHVRVDSFEQGFRMIDLGRADYYAVNRLVGYHTLRQLQLVGIHALDDNLSPPSPIYLAFRKSGNFDALSARFSSALKAFKETDAHAEILQRYIDAKLARDSSLASTHQRASKESPSIDISAP